MELLGTCSCLFFVNGITGSVSLLFVQDFFNGRKKLETKK